MAKPDPTPPARPPEPRRADLATPYALALMAVVAAFFFWPFVTGDAFLWEDFVEFTYPHQVFAARSVAQGITPWWNPFAFNGMPFIADPQMGFYYPLHQLMYRVAGDPLSPILFQAIVVLHYPIAMLGMWALARGLGLGNWGAAVAGIGFALSGMLMVHMIHPNLVEQVAWFPLAIHCFRRGVVERRLAFAIGAGVVLGVSFLAGYPQFVVYELLFIAMLGAGYLARDWRAGGRREAAATAVHTATTALLAVGIFAVQLLPSLELSRLSDRAELTYERSLDGAIGPGQLLTLIAPKYFGVTSAQAAPDHVPYWYGDLVRPVLLWHYWEMTIYIGVTILALAVIGLAAGRLGRFGWLLAVLGGTSLLYALGDRFIVYPLLGRLPLLRDFRVPTRLTLYFVVAGALLAGAGVDALCGGRLERRVRRTALLTCGALAAVALAILGGGFHPLLQPRPEFAANAAASGLAPLILTLVLGVTVVLAQRGAPKGHWTGAALLTLVVIDLSIFGLVQNRRRLDPRGDVFEPQAREFAGYRAQIPESLFRVKMRNQRGVPAMKRNLGLYSGIMLYDGYNPLTLSRREPVAANADQVSDLLAVRYERIDSIRGVKRFVTRATPFPHARMMYRTQVFPDEMSLRSALQNGRVDVGTTVALEREPTSRIAGGEGDARVTRYDAGMVVAEVDGTAPGILLLSDIWYPAWHATIDDQPAELLRADGALRAVAVPAGRHQVVLRYESRAGTLGAFVTVTTLALAAIGLLVATLRTRARLRDAS